VFLKTTIKLPIAFLKQVYKERLFSSLKVYCWVQFNSSGVIKSTPLLKKTIALDLGYSIKTVENCILKLNELGWFRSSKSNNNIRVIGINKILEQRKIKNNLSIKIFSNDVKYLKQCMIGGVLKVIYNRILKNQDFKKRWSNEWCERKRFNGAIDISNNHLAKYLDIAISSASELRKEAFKNGYCFLERSFEVINCTSNEIQFYKNNHPFGFRIRTTKINGKNLFVLDKSSKVLPKTTLTKRKMPKL